MLCMNTGFVVLLHNKGKSPFSECDHLAKCKTGECSCYVIFVLFALYNNVFVETLLTLKHLNFSIQETCAVDKV